MSKYWKIIGEFIREVAAGVTAIETHNRITGNNGENNAAELLRQEFNAFLVLLDKQTQKSITAHFTRFDENGQGDWFMDGLSILLRALKMKGTADAEIKEIFTDIANESIEEVKIRLRMIKKEPQVQIIAKNITENVVKPFNEGIEHFTNEVLKPWALEMKEKQEKEEEEYKKMSFWGRLKHGYYL